MYGSNTEEPDREKSIRIRTIGEYGRIDLYSRNEDAHAGTHARVTRGRFPLDSWDEAARNGWITGCFAPPP